MRNRQEVDRIIAKRDNETPEQHTNRLQQEVYRTHDESVQVLKQRNGVGIAGVVAAALALILGAVLFNRNGLPDGHVAVEKSKYDVLVAQAGDASVWKGKYEVASSKKAELVCNGASTEEVRKLVAEQCIGKTVAGPIRWRDRPVAVVATPAPAPGCGTNCPGDRVRVTVQPDRCIFRIDGEIKATTEFAGGTGSTQCPQWRDAMLKKYNQNPADKIWERQYPTGKPL